jgi:hypothetical protein
MAIVISKLEDKLIIKFPYSPERISKIKTIRGYSWNAVMKEWSVPYTTGNIEALRSLFRNEQVAIDFICNETNERIINLVDEQLKLKGYSFKARKTYIKQLKWFSSFIAKDLDSINTQDVRSYVVFLLEERKASHSYANQAISSIKFLCNDTLNQGKVIDNLPRPKKENKLPNVLSF